VLHFVDWPERVSFGLALGHLFLHVVDSIDFKATNFLGSRSHDLKEEMICIHRKIHACGIGEKS
jgi:hypothetical protein